MGHLHLNPGDLGLMVVTLFDLFAITRWAFKENFWKPSSRRALLLGADFVLGTAAILEYCFSYHRYLRLIPMVWATWIGAFAVCQAAILSGLCLALLVWRNLPDQNLQRRRFLQTAGVGLAVAPYAAITVGIIIRNQFSVKEVKIRIPNLPKDLEGLRLVQLTDIHLSPFLSELQFARAIDMANETKAHLALVTGDLITAIGDPLDACLRQLARLRCDAGALGCLGNHEEYTNTSDYVQAQGKRIGIDFLRKEARLLRFGDAHINFAGVDYQGFREPYLVGTERLIVPGQVNVLLSHNPDVFPVAARQGFDVTIAGHTHGGQVNVEILHQNMNFARTFTPFVRGLYRQGDASVYVSSGIGTIGVPVRLGAPPEVNLIQLCAS